MSLNWKIDNSLGFANPSGARHSHVNWRFKPESCPCDAHFLDWLTQNKVSGKRIFHMGTGLHHIVGLSTLDTDTNNDILAITVGPKEHAAYVKLLLKHPELARHYKVLFADIYSLTPATVPEMDIVTLFHLCEFYNPGSPSRIHDDKAVLEQFLQQLNPNGVLIFFTGSNAWQHGERGPSAADLVTPLIESGRLHAEQFKSLLVCRVNKQPD